MNPHQLSRALEQVLSAHEGLSAANLLVCNDAFVSALPPPTHHPTPRDEFASKDWHPRRRRRRRRRHRALASQPTASVQEHHPEGADSLDCLVRKPPPTHPSAFVGPHLLDNSSPAMGRCSCAVQISPTSASRHGTDGMQRKTSTSGASRKCCRSPLSSSVWDARRSTEGDPTKQDDSCAPCLVKQGVVQRVGNGGKGVPLSPLYM